MNLFCTNTGVNGHVASLGNNLELTSLDEVTNDLTCKCTTDLVSFDKSVKSKHFTLGCAANNLFVECLGESNTVVFLFTEFVLCPFFLGLTCLGSRLCSEKLLCLGLLNFRRL